MKIQVAGAGRHGHRLVHVPGPDEGREEAEARQREEEARLSTLERPRTPTPSLVRKRPRDSG
ncbi:MAG TPA: hypothetical protein VJJ24_03510 [Candidatus Paceibacterota bacterium]